MLVGGAFLALGILLAVGGASDFDGGGLVARWWPVAAIVLGMAQLSAGGRTGGGMLIGTGAVLLGFTTGVLEGMAARLVGPLVLVLVGWWVLSGRRLRGEAEAAGPRLNAFAALGRGRMTFTGSVLNRASATAILAGLELDLRRARPAEEGARLIATVVLGSLNVIVPEGWRVRIRGLPLLGVWDDTTRRNAIRPEAPVLDVNAVVALGGLEVRHAYRWQRSEIRRPTGSEG